MFVEYQNNHEEYENWNIQIQGKYVLKLILSDATSENGNEDKQEPPSKKEHVKCSLDLHEKFVKAIRNSMHMACILYLMLIVCKL